MTVALITGVNGQDGSYLAELLLSKSYTVIGTVRGKNPKWPYGFNPDQPNLIIRHLDLGYPDSFRSILVDVASHGEDVECYNLASQSHVGDSFQYPAETYVVTGVGASLLMREFFQMFPSGKFYQASTSEMFGNHLPGMVLDETSDFRPCSPYAESKLMAHHTAERYRSKGYFVVSGILFNHESERRHESFVTQKIAKHAALAKLYRQGKVKKYPWLHLGNTQAIRDWGYAPQYVEIMWRLLRQDIPLPRVIATGRVATVEEFAQKAFAYVDIDPANYIVTDPNLYRPQDIGYLCGDPTIANNLLDDHLIDVDQLVPVMVDHQLRLQKGDTRW